MIKSQILLILSLLWIGNSLARSVQPHPDDYDYTEVVRSFPKVYRSRTDDDLELEQRPTIQTYWQNFVRNIPFRFNMTNPIGNLFNAGTQPILESTVGVHQDVEPNRRRRKNPKRKSLVKKTKTRRRSNARDHRDYYNYAHIGGGGSGDYHQLELQPIGVGAGNSMHFYDPNTGNYYALQLVASPGQYYSHSGHSAYVSNEDDDEDEDDSYSGEDDDHDHHNHHDHDNHGSHEEFDHHHRDYDNEDYNGIAEAAVESNNDYADDIQIVDNWGYTDEDIFGERKLKGGKGNLKPIKTKLAPRIGTLQKNRLKTVKEQDVKVLPTENIQKPTPKQTPQASEEEAIESTQNRVKPTSSENAPEDANAESVRNVLGTFMKDDSTNKRRQSTTTRILKQRFVERPRQRERYYIYPHYIL